MALHAEAVAILIEKGRFEPEVALSIAEAIEVSVVHAQFVTVPILDARLQTLKAETSVSLMSLESKLSASIQELKTELKTEMERTKADLVRWVFLAMLGNVGEMSKATLAHALVYLWISLLRLERLLFEKHSWGRFRAGRSRKWFQYRFRVLDSLFLSYLPTYWE